MNKATELGKEYRPSMHPDVLHCWAYDAARSLKELGKLLDDWDNALEATSNQPSIVMKSIVKEILDKAFPE